MLREVIGSQEEQKYAILLGDFNLHHPSWGGIHVPADAHAERLIDTINDFDLELVLPQGEITWARNHVKSTIDLIFATSIVSRDVISCRTRPELGTGKDHYPIFTTVNLRVEKTAQIERFALKRLDKAGFLGTLLADLKQRRFLPNDITLKDDGSIDNPRDVQRERLSDHGEIEDAVKGLTQSITQAMEKHCPKAKPSKFERRGWSHKCTELVRKQRRARRQATRSGDLEDQRQAKRLRQQIKAQLREDATRA